MSGLRLRRGEVTNQSWLKTEELCIITAVFQGGRNRNAGTVEMPTESCFGSCKTITLGLVLRAQGWEHELDYSRTFTMKRKDFFGHKVASEILLQSPELSNTV